jgi:hypothetical protein
MLMFLRIAEVQWVNTEHIETVQVSDGGLKLFANGEQSDDDGTLAYYIVEEEYVADVCSMLNLPVFDVDTLIIAQTKEKENDEDLSTSSD